MTVGQITKADRLQVSPRREVVSGDQCLVKGFGKEQFTFLHVATGPTGKRWADVLSDEQKMRSFPIDLIKNVPSKKRKG